MNNYFKVWWDGLQVKIDFKTKEEAEKYIRKMRIRDWEIVEFNSDIAVVNRWVSE